MKRLLRTKIILFLSMLTVPFTSLYAQDSDRDNFRQRQLDLIRKIQEQFEADQAQMDQFFDDQFFKQADQMFKQLQDGKDPFDAIINNFQQKFGGALKAPKQWEERKEGMAFILPYILGPQDKIDLKIKDEKISIEVKRQISSGLNRSQSYEFPIPKGCDATQMEIIKEQAKTVILFPWEEKFEKVRPSPRDKVI